jgi:pilus assembly protein CpaB
VGRLRGFVWLFAGLILAGLAGIVAFITLTRAVPSTEGGESAVPKVSVVTAARTIPVRSALTREDLELKQVAVDAVPDGAISTLEEAEGKLSLAELYPGEVLLTRRLLDPNIVTGDGRLSLYAASDQVLMAIPASDLLSRMWVLKPGDRIDIAVTLEFDVEVLVQQSATGESAATNQPKQMATFYVLQNVGVAAVLSTGGTVSTVTEVKRDSGDVPQALLVTLSPQDALVLKYVLDAGGIQDIVLRAPGVEHPFETEPVDAAYVIDRYRIPILTR